MAYFSLPDRLDDQLALILALSRVVFLKFDEKMELERIQSSLEYHQTLTMREKAFLEVMIKKYGIYA